MRLLTEEQKHWVEVIGDFCKKEIEPIMLIGTRLLTLPRQSPLSPMQRRSSWA